MSFLISRRHALRYGAGTAIVGASAGTAWMWADDAQHQAAPAYRAWRQKEKGDLSDTAYMALCAGLAPSAHNTQPWKFRLDGQRIEVYADRARHLASADASHRMMQLSVGCALENLAVAAQQLGYRAEIAHNDADLRFHDDGRCATVQLHRTTAIQHPWFDALFERRTHRGVFRDAAMLPAQLQSTLSSLARDLPGVGLHCFTGEGSGAHAVRALQKVVRDSVRDFLTEARHRDGMDWFRITRSEWERQRDGIAIFTSDAPSPIKRYIEWFATESDLLSEPFRQGEIDAVDRVASATPFWGLVYAEHSSVAQRLQAGRLAERVCLFATTQQLSVHPLCYPTEIKVHAHRLRQIAGLAPGVEPLFLFRLGQAGASGAVGHSVRRELKDLLLT